MKKILTVGVVITTLVPLYARAALNCMSKWDCSDKLKSGCCCPTGETGTDVSCPSGWSLSNGVCTRASTSGSNAAGTYTKTYGTCSPTESAPYDCYTISLSNTGARCICKNNNLEPDLDIKE